MVMQTNAAVKRHTLRAELVRNRQLYILAIPVVLFYLIFCYFPMVGIVIAFKNYNVAEGIFAGEWIGLKNFRDFFSSVYFTRTLRNTILISLYDLLYGFPAPVILALLINELRGKVFKRVVQTVTYLPHFISMVVICGMIVDFFGTEGILTKVIVALGGKQMNYVGSAAHFRSIYVGTNIWQSVGWNSIIYLAALAGIDQQLYEAAVIDGAGRLRQAWHVTLPVILPTIVIMLILRIGQLLSVGYEKIILLYGPATYETADIISSYVYRMGLSGGRYGFSTAVGLFQSVINLALLLFANFFSKRLTDTSLF